MVKQLSAIAQGFSCEFSVTFKDAFFTKQIRATTSETHSKFKMTSEQLQLILLRKIRQFHLISWCENFAERYSFRTFFAVHHIVFIQKPILSQCSSLCQCVPLFYTNYCEVMKSTETEIKVNIGLTEFSF